MRRERVPQPEKAAGYTLLEVVIAMSVFAILALSMSASLASAMQANRRARDRDRARGVAIERMEEILAWTDFGTLTNFDGNAFEVPELTRTDGSSVGQIAVYNLTAETIRVDILVIWNDVSLAGNGSDGETRLEVNTVITNKSGLGSS